MTALRWKRRKEFRSSELLDAAVSVFAEKGFASARLEDIAARAGVSKGTVYLYFDSKEAILKALIKAIPVARVEAFEQLAAADTGPADQTLRNVLQLFGAMIRDPMMIQFPRLVIGESGNFPWIAETYRQEVVSRGIAMLSGIIGKGIAQGRFRDVDAKRAAFAAIAPVLFVAIWRTTFERFDDTQLDAQAFIDQHIETFVRGLAREGGV